MLQHEAEVEKAKQEGTTIPTFEPVLPKTNIPVVKPTEELEKQWKEKLEKLPEDERAVEEAALRADLHAKAEVAENVQKIWDLKREERGLRQSEGKGTFTDTLATLWGRGSGK